jgi:hypothetical protein
MKKILLISAAVVFSTISIFFFNQLFKWLIAYLLLGNNYTVNFNGITLLISFQTQSSISIIQYVIVIISPLIMSIIFIELAMFGITKLSNTIFKNISIVYVLINIGYIIFAVILGMMSVIFKANFSTDWYTILSSQEFSYNEKLLIIFLSLILLIGYINTVTKRIKKFISVINLYRKQL